MSNTPIMPSTTLSPLTSGSARAFALPSQRDVRRNRRRLLAAVLLCLMAAAGGLLAWFALQPAGDTGSYLIPQGTMSDEQAQQMLDEQADKSRIQVSLRPVQELKDGKLHVNFVVAADNNGFAERLEIVQDGLLVYASGIVQPNHTLSWVEAPAAHPGDATATVYAVGDNGEDFGNPVSVEVSIAQA